MKVRMNSRRLLLFVIPLCFFVSALTPLYVAPENRIKLTAFSDWISVVEITSVALGDEKTGDGIGERQLEVKGRILEMIRGSAPENNEFRGSKEILRVIDGKQYSKKRSVQELEFIHAAADRKTGIEDCKVGHRYLVIRCVVGRAYIGEFFVEVSEDDEKWRSMILKRDYSYGDPAPEAPHKKKPE